MPAAVHLRQAVAHRLRNDRRQHLAQVARRHTARVAATRAARSKLALAKKSVARWTGHAVFAPAAELERLRLVLLLQPHAGEHVRAAERLHRHGHDQAAVGERRVALRLRLMPFVQK